MTDDLDALLEGYTGAYLKYPEPRRAIEAKLMTAIVAEIKALKDATLHLCDVEIPVLKAAVDGIGDQHPDLNKAVMAAKRKPGRPAKEAA